MRIGQKCFFYLKIFQIENFTPFVNFYIQLLINDDKLGKAKKLLKKTWSALPHPDLKQTIKILSKALNISYFELVRYISSNDPVNYETRILLTECFIEEQNWEKARHLIKSLLKHQPLREVCLLMSQIEEGESGDPEKINAWISRSNLGKLNKIWVCHISRISQTQWTPVSKGGYFNTLEWRYPNSISELQSPAFEMSSIDYIDE